MNEKLSLSRYSQARNFFEGDAQFSGANVTAILDAYNEAARAAGLLARFALTKPEYRERALWAEASASTLERVLALFEEGCASKRVDGKPWRLEGSQ